MIATAKPASPKQIAFAHKLLAEKDIAANDRQTIEVQLAEATTKTASSLIDLLMAQPSKPLADSEKAKPGYYVREADGSREFIVVVENKAKTSTYAKRLTQYGTKWTWEYAPGVGRTLAGLEPLTVTEAAKFGHLHGVCLVCAKELTNPKSVQAGIGPVCAKRLA